MFLRNPKKYVCISFLVTAVLIFGVSVFMMFDKTEYAETSGTIVDIVTYPGHDIHQPDENHVYIDYRAGGRWFKRAEYGAYDSSMEIGDKVKVYYDKTDPSLIQPEGFRLVPYVTGSVSLVVIVVTVTMLIRMKRKSEE